MAREHNHIQYRAVTRETIADLAQGIVLSFRPATSHLENPIGGVSCELIRIGGNSVWRPQIG
jgi:hypothetical protein